MHDLCKIYAIYANLMQFMPNMLKNIMMPNMQKKYAKSKDPMCKICKKYAKIRSNMQKICNNMQDIFSLCRVYFACTWKVCIGDLKFALRRRLMTIMIRVIIRVRTAWHGELQGRYGIRLGGRRPGSGGATQLSGSAPPASPLATRRRARRRSHRHRWQYTSFLFFMENPLLCFGAAEILLFFLISRYPAKIIGTIQFSDRLHISSENIRVISPASFSSIDWMEFLRYKVELVGLRDDCQYILQFSLIFDDNGDTVSTEDLQWAASFEPTWTVSVQNSFSHVQVSGCFQPDCGLPFISFCADVPLNFIIVCELFDAVANAANPDSAPPISKTHNLFSVGRINESSCNSGVEKYYLRNSEDHHEVDRRSRSIISIADSANIE